MARLNAPSGTSSARRKGRSFSAGENRPWGLRGPGWGGFGAAGRLAGAALASGPALAQEQATYQYDAFGRLLAVARSVTGSTGAYTTYGNDAADNRLSRSVTSVPALAVVNELRSGETLVPFQKLTSTDGRFSFLFQADGNVVLYFGATPLWASNTMNGRGLTLRMESGGNLALYDAANAVVWSSGTGGNPGAKLVLQNDGNAVIFDGATPLWSTNTCCH